MKRTNVVLDEDLLQEASQVLGEKTYSAAINTALREAIRMKRVRDLREHFGKGLWEGNLAEMREDRPQNTEAKAGQ